MALFQYKAIDPQGKKIEGYIAADSIIFAKEELRKSRFFVTNVAPFVEKPLKDTKQAIASFTYDIALLLQSSFPLYDALLTLKEKYLGHELQWVISLLAEQIKLGKSFSQALSVKKELFGEVMIAMTHAGEESGQLAQVLKEVSVMQQRELSVKKKLTSALTYPAILLSFTLIVVTALFAVLIPALKDLFEGKQLHPLTQTVLSVSDFFSDNIAILTVTIPTTSFLLFLFFRTPQGTACKRRIVSSLPFISTLWGYVLLSRYARVLSILLQGGVSFASALSLSEELITIPQWKKGFVEAKESVMRGTPFSHALRALPLPPLFVRMIQVGEETGDLPKMLAHIASMFDEELEKSLSKLQMLLQPILLLIMGLVVGIVLLAVLLPLSDVSAILDG